MNNKDLIDNLINIAIQEDIGEEGDHTSKACIKKDTKGSAKLLIKEDGILAGVSIAKRIFNKIDSSLEINVYIDDGSKVYSGDIAFIVKGNVVSILQAERLVLNFMQRMSGIATMTNKFVEKVKDIPVKILDTRKTTPGLRYFEKEAIRLGGGVNHRFGLYDMILIKDNHIDYSGSIEKAIKNVQEYIKKNNLDLKIVIEARNLEDVKEIIRIGNVHRILLDNFTIEDTKKAVKIIDGKFEIESSGGITLENIREYALCGVNYISVGALTHQIYSLDMSLKAIKE